MGGGRRDRKAGLGGGSIEYQLKGGVSRGKDGI